MAKKSVKYNCPKCGLIVKLLPELKQEEEAKEEKKDSSIKDENQPKN